MVEPKRGSKNLALPGWSCHSSLSWTLGKWRGNTSHWGYAIHWLLALSNLRPSAQGDRPCLSLPFTDLEHFLTQGNNANHCSWKPPLVGTFSLLLFHFLCMLHTCLVVCWAVQVFLGCLKPGLIFPTTLYTPVSRGSTGFLPQHVWAGFLQSPFTSSFGGSCCC